MKSHFYADCAKFAIFGIFQAIITSQCIIGERSVAYEMLARTCVTPLGSSA